MIAQRPQSEDFPEWMDLKTAQRYACLSERTLREWIHLPQNPLPAVQVNRGKILIRRTLFDGWLERHPFESIGSLDIDGIAEGIINELKRAA
jgi:excisionase family DNA binding protein